MARAVAAALLAALLTLATAIYGPRAVGGADEYGYASQADLWLKGRLTIDQNFVRQVPWPFAERTFAPLGYHPHPADRGLIVPTYSPGFPMLLALAKAIAGQDGLFLVVPICAGLLVFATYAIGSRLGSPAAGLVAAWLTATSPTVLFMSMATMSDVPVAAAWAWAFVLLLGHSRLSAGGAGALSAIAILIRPNLAPLAGVLALRYVFDLRRADRRRDAALGLVAYSAALLPGIVVVALVNDRLHGSPWTSGYGPLAELFSLRRVPQNFVLYIRWLAQAHTPIALLGLAAIVVPLRRVRPPQQTAGLSIVIALFTVAVWGIYCAWLVFDVWWYTRFMLSSWPFVMLALGSLTVAASTAAPTYVRPAIAAAVIALGVYQVHFAAERQAFGARDARRRFVAAARVVRNHTDRNSVIISQDHNGSIRYYGGRMTLDSEWVPRGAALDAAIAWLKAHGVHTYAAIEDWELERLRRRFGDARAALALERPPVAIHEHQGRMLLFDLTDPRPLEARPAVERNVDIGSRAAPPVPLSRLNFREE